MTKLIIRLWYLLNKKRKLQFIFLIFFMVIVSFAELISIGAIIPFIGIITSPDALLKNQYIAFLLEYFNIKTKDELLLPFTAIFIVSALVSGTFRVSLLWINTRLSFALGAELSVLVYTKSLYQDYIFHTNNNSSEIINGIINKTNTVIYNILMPILILISSFVLPSTMVVTMIAVDPISTISVFTTFGLAYYIIMIFFKKKLLQDSTLIANVSNYLIKNLQEGFGAIREIIIDNTQEYYCKEYHKADLKLRKAQGNGLFISGSPRFIMETIAIILIALAVFIMSKKGGDLINSLPILGALALGAQKLLPILQQSFSSWTAMQVGRISLIDVLELLETKISKDEEFSKDIITFNQSINLSGIFYKYNSARKWILNDISLEIKKGEKIGIIGETGSGKSTLIDIIIGLLKPNKGSIYIDSNKIDHKNQKNWRSRIANVPQNIFLLDVSIEENISLTDPNKIIDHKKVVKAAKAAAIHDTIMKLPQKYKTKVGEGGIRLSGGQKQRIGIARALYKDASIIVLDEATSALDTKTEKKVMESIDKINKNITLIIIAHRLSTLKNCDKIIELNGGKITKIKDQLES